MFTGIIEEIGFIQTISSTKIKIKCGKVIDNTKIGDSISVSGVCLTVVELGDDYFVADVSPETYSTTTLSKLKILDAVNLERAMLMGGRFGGHIVSGHVDGVGKVVLFSKQGDFYNLDIELQEQEKKYVIKKGSVSINGISLTVASVNENVIRIAVIPETIKNTNLNMLKVADLVNVEVDPIAKYVEKFLLMRDNKTGISMDFLQRNGFC